MASYFRPGTYALVPNKHLLPQMKGAPLSVYVVLCSHADDNGICYPGIKRIMAMTGYEKDAVFRALKTLIELGVIERNNRFTEKGDMDSNLYRILLSEVGTEVVGGSSAEASTPSRKSDYPSSAEASTGSRSEATLTKPSELTHLRKEINKEKTAPASPETIRRVRERLAKQRPGTFGKLAVGDDDILRHSQLEALKGESGKDTEKRQKPVKLAVKSRRRAVMARHAISQTANVQLA